MRKSYFALLADSQIYAVRSIINKIHPDYEEMISMKLCVGYLSIRFGIAGGRIFLRLLGTE